MKQKAKDNWSFRCSKCNTVYGKLGHLELYNKRICNKCCDTAIIVNGLFKGCECKKGNNDDRISKKIN